MRLKSETWTDEDGLVLLGCCFCATAMNIVGRYSSAVRKVSHLSLADDLEWTGLFAFRSYSKGGANRLLREKLPGKRLVTIATVAMSTDRDRQNPACQNGVCNVAKYFG